MKCPFQNRAVVAFVAESRGRLPDRLDPGPGGRVRRGFVAERRGEDSRGLQSTDGVLRTGGAAERRVKWVSIMEFDVTSDICGNDRTRRSATPGFLRHEFRGLKPTATFDAPRRGADDGSGTCP